MKWKRKTANCQDGVVAAGPLVYNTVQITRAVTRDPSVKTRTLQRVIRTSYYITDTFERRECCKFIPHSQSYPDRCGCGRSSEDHVTELTDWSSKTDFYETWDSKEHTISLPTNAYGEINFMEAENDLLPLYLRCSIGTGIELISNLLIKRWTLPSPNLLISVFGGHNKFDESLVESLDDIKSGICEAAISTKAWIFTSGVNKGVSRVVGDAIARKRSFINSIPVIGVTSWGAVKNNKLLVNEQGLFPAHYYAEKERADPYIEEIRRQGRVPYMALEHEHTHFILLDKGTSHLFHEIDVRRYRIKLQLEVATRTNAQVISVLMDGGVGSLHETQMRLNAGLPIVVLGNTGRIADVISYAFSISDNSIGQNILQSNEDRHNVLSKLARAIPGRSTDDYTEFLDIIEDILRHEKLVTVWYVEKDGQLDKTILKGLIKSLKSSGSLEQNPSLISASKKVRKLAKEKDLLKRQLKLAIKWDRLDVANDYIFVNMKFVSGELNELLGVAIAHKRASFVRNMISRGAKIRSFLTRSKFDELLNSVPKDCYLHRLLSEKCKDGVEFTYQHLREVVEDISEGVYHCPRKIQHSCAERSGFAKLTESITDTFYYLKVRVSMPGRGYSARRDEDTEELQDGSDTEATNKHGQMCDFEAPEDLLVVYFTLLHEHEMAQLFWEYSTAPLLLALVSRHIHIWMARKEAISCEITTEIQQRLETYADELGRIAYSILNEASLNYPRDLIRDFITYRYKAWGGISFLELADYSEARDIIAHNCVQDHIEAEWEGILDPDISTTRIFISILCPLLAPTRASKRIQQDQDKNRSQKKKVEDRRRLFIKRPSTLLGWDLPVEQEISVSQKLKEIYKAPKIKFYIYLVTYMAFMMCYVFALLLKQKDGDVCRQSMLNLQRIFNCNFSRTETLVFLWVLALVPLEIRQIYFAYPATLKGKLRVYLSSTYNKNDILCNSLILTAFLTKYLPSDDFNSAMVYDSIYRFLFALAFVFYCARLCQALQINKRMGPKVMMLHRMMLDLVFFIVLVAMFLIAYGVSSAALTNPNKKTNLTGELLFDIFWRPYVNLYGDFREDEVVESMSQYFCEYKNDHYKRHNETDRILNCSAIKYDCAAKGTDTYNSICLANQYFVKALLAVYMMLAAVLMLNLLVAVFSNTYANLESSSEILWKWQQYDLMKEFRERSSFPIPFSTFIYCGKFISWMYRKMCGRCGCCPSNNKMPSPTLTMDNEHEQIKFSLLESECRQRYLQKSSEESYEQVVQQTLRCLERSVEHLCERVNEFDDSLQNVLDAKLSDDTEKGAGYYCETISPDSDSGGGDSMSVEEVFVEVADVGVDMSVESSSLKQDRTATSTHEMVKSVNFEKLLKMGKRSRKMEYPNTSIRRSYVKKEHWDWKHPLIRYKPTIFSDPSLTPERKPAEITWNALVNGDERRSYEGRYMVQQNMALNPVGRTGLCGRGQLPRWGPNFISLPIITRFVRRSNGDRETIAGKNVFEVLLQHARNNTLTLPEIMAERDEALPSGIKNFFSQEDLGCDDTAKPKLLRRIGKVFNGGVLIYRGYLDSEANTDNSWLEAIAVSYHDTNGNALDSVILPPDAKFVWKIIRNDTPIGDVYRKFLQRAFYIRNGYDNVALHSSVDNN